MQLPHCIYFLLSYEYVSLGSLGDLLFWAFVFMFDCRKHHLDCSVSMKNFLEGHALVNLM